MTLTLQTLALAAAVRHARTRALTSHSAAARTLMGAGVPFAQACAYAMHCARQARSFRGL
jgi:hypothetical protein